MGQLERRLSRLEDISVRQHVDRQMATAAPVLASLGIPPEEWPGIRRDLEDEARWFASHAPLTPDQVEAEIQRVAAGYAAELGIDPAEVRAEADRIAELIEARR